MAPSGFALVSILVFFLLVSRVIMMPATLPRCLRLLTPPDVLVSADSIVFLARRLLGLRRAPPAHHLTSTLLASVFRLFVSRDRVIAFLDGLDLPVYFCAASPSSTPPLLFGHMFLVFLPQSLPGALPVSAPHSVGPSGYVSFLILGSFCPSQRVVWTSSPPT